MFVLYIIAILLSNRKYRKWPTYRTVYWMMGVFAAIVAVAGPLAVKAHVYFTAHMLAHLFLGMLAPLLLALGAPVTLFLRTINVKRARRITKLLKRKPIRIVTDPIVASTLNIGGLWLLYTTSLYTVMHEHILIHILVHVHLFLAGYLFTISMIYIDPAAHRTSYLYRSVVFILALAGHGILSKYIYVNPPEGVTEEQGEIGAMIMYYGGDLVDIIIIFMLCLQWYRETRPRFSLEINNFPTKNI
ncbi:putative membrane protein [Evansella vedderi]|uniref:Membrane protein n=1 Tax=Evansella vedderi TaxID=38282 RepID=A0ABT9ZXU2_9BACI|nr:cytochrome c oxidase assembly protein [Evansella vedderi]MDQ0256056.1 putative membrane protein [Evansella vedderi]